MNKIKAANKDEIKAALEAMGFPCVNAIINDRFVRRWEKDYFIVETSKGRIRHTLAEAVECIAKPYA